LPNKLSPLKACSQCGGAAPPPLTPPFTTLRRIDGSIYFPGREFNRAQFSPGHPFIWLYVVCCSSPWGRPGCVDLTALLELVAVLFEGIRKSAPGRGGSVSMFLLSLSPSPSPPPCMFSLQVSFPHSIPSVVRFFGLVQHDGVPRGHQCLGRMSLPSFAVFVSLF